MATATRKLFVNWHTKALQFSDRSGAGVTLPEFNKYEAVPFEVVIVEPDPTSTRVLGFRRVDISNLSMAMALNDTRDDAAPLAYQPTFTKDEDSNIFAGELNLNTAALNSWLDADSKTGIFEIEVQEGTAVNKILVVEVTVKKGVIQVGAVAPTPADSYYTKDQADQQFMKPVGQAGRQQTYTSISNTYQRIIGVTDDGQPIDQIIPVVP